MFVDQNQEFEGSILITQCLQKDFIDLNPPSPNKLNLGPRMIKMMRGDLEHGEDRLSDVIRQVYTGPGNQNIIKVHVRDWHNQMDPAQQDELNYFQPHCLEDSQGAEFAGSLNEHAYSGEIEPLNSPFLNDFVETQLESVLNEITAGRKERWRIGIFGVYTGIKVLYNVIDLRTRLKFPHVAVFGNLCGDNKLSRHQIALEHMSEILQCSIFNTGNLNELPMVTNSFLKWMGLKVA
jgi:nicotinamidase-related amidase